MGDGLHCSCSYEATSCPRHGFASKQTEPRARENVSGLELRPIDRLARELAMAVVEWLASDGDDDKFAVVDRLAGQWKTTVIDDVRDDCGSEKQ